MFFFSSKGFKQPMQLAQWVSLLPGEEMSTLF